MSAADERCLRLTGVHGNLILIRPENIIRTESGPGWTRLYNSEGAWLRVRETEKDIEMMRRRAGNEKQGAV